MSHLEQRLEKDLNEIQEHIASMGKSVETGLENAFTALQTADEKLAFTTILSDLPINRQMRKIDKLCHAFIAVHLPSAGHLRYLSSVIRANIILERIGDYAVTIARESVQIGCIEESDFIDELNRISSDVKLVLHESITAFNRASTEGARRTIKMAIQVEQSMDEIYARLMDSSKQDNNKDVIISLIIFSQLKRVADQSKNLAEETIFIETGEAKKPKIYRIHFVDQDNSCLGPMAQLIAQKILPDIGSYSSSGGIATKELHSKMVEFMQSRNFDISDVNPQQIDSSREALSSYHVLVGLNNRVQNTVKKIPFRTSILNWQGIKVPEDESDNWDTLYKELAYQIRELMLLLRGDEN